MKACFNLKNIDEVSKTTCIPLPTTAADPCNIYKVISTTSREPIFNKIGSRNKLYNLEKMLRQLLKPEGLDSGSISNNLNKLSNSFNQSSFLLFYSLKYRAQFLINTDRLGFSECIVDEDMPAYAIDIV